jgi:predicted transposase YbfD/YdcC
MKKSVVLAEQERCLDKSALIHQVGYWTEEVQMQVEKAIFVADGIDINKYIKNEIKEETIDLNKINADIRFIFEMERLIDKREYLSEINCFIRFKQEKYNDLVKYCSSFHVNAKALIQKARQKQQIMNIEKKRDAAIG